MQAILASVRLHYLIPIICGKFSSKCLISKRDAMSEMQTNTSKRPARGVAKLNRLSTRVDLTPMVDLGFLLITFFIFTTSMAQPKAMNLIMPDDSNIEEPSQAPADLTLTFLLHSNHTIYYYQGQFDGSLSTTNFSKNEIREVIRLKAKEVEENFGDRKKTIILIKVTDQATYSDIVNALDEC